MLLTRNVTTKHRSSFSWSDAKENRRKFWNSKFFSQSQQRQVAIQSNLFHKDDVLKNFGILLGYKWHSQGELTLHLFGVKQRNPFWSQLWPPQHCFNGGLFCNIFKWCRNWRQWNQKFKHDNHFINVKKTCTLKPWR